MKNLNQFKKISCSPFSLKLLSSSSSSRIPKSIIFLFHNHSRESSSSSSFSRFVYSNPAQILIPQFKQNYIGPKFYKCNNCSTSHQKYSRSYQIIKPSSIQSFQFSKAQRTAVLMVDPFLTESVRFCSSKNVDSHSNYEISSSQSSSTAPTYIINIKLNLSFSNGYFSLRFASRECLFHFWSPIELAIKMIQEELTSAAPPSSSEDESSRLIPGVEESDLLQQLDIEIEYPPATVQQPHPRFDHIKFGRIEMVAEHNDSSSDSSTESDSGRSSDEQSSESSGKLACKNRYRLARLMPFGYALLGCELDEVYFVGTGTGTIVAHGPDNYRPHITKALRINFKLFDKTKTLKNDIEAWHQRNPLDSQTMLFKTKTIDPNLYEQNELVFLQQERQLVLEKFQPLQQEFEQLIQDARKESRRKFKFGGLFLLSAQLGFVGRLTYFEYSWDIMEPVTWIMTYTTMVGSFAYYIITSEEYVVPLVEKRMVASRFWKLAQTNNFDVKRYKRLKEELKQLEKRISKLRAGF